MTAPGIRGLIFDLDMTLLDREASLKPWLAEIAGGLAPEAQARFRARFAGLDAWGQGSRKTLFRSLAAEFGLAEPMLRQGFMGPAWRQLVHDPDAGSVLALLRGSGLRLGLLSEGLAALQRRKLGVLAVHFDALRFSGAGLHKPDPRLFALAAADLGLQPGECAYVGDHPVMDLQGAAAAGMATIWLRRYAWPQPVRANLELGALSELPSALAGMSASHIDA